MSSGRCPSPMPRRPPRRRADAIALGRVLGLAEAAVPAPNDDDDVDVGHGVEVVAALSEDLDLGRRRRQTLIGRQVQAALKRRSQAEDGEEEPEELRYPTFALYQCHQVHSSKDISSLVFSRHAGTSMLQEEMSTGLRRDYQLHMMATTLCSYQIHRNNVWETSFPKAFSTMSAASASSGMRHSRSSPRQSPRSAWTSSLTSAQRCSLAQCHTEVPDHDAQRLGAQPES